MKFPIRIDIDGSVISEASAREKLLEIVGREVNRPVKRIGSCIIGVVRATLTGDEDETSERTSYHILYRKGEEFEASRRPILEDEIDRIGNEGGGWKTQEFIKLKLDLNKLS